MEKNLFDLGINVLNPKSKRAKKRQLTPAQKIWAWENRPHTCHICLKRVTKFSDAEFDHARAHVKGGATSIANVKICHRACNRIKGTKSSSETRRFLGIKTKSKRRKTTKKAGRSPQKARGFSNPFANVEKERFGGL